MSTSAELIGLHLGLEGLEAAALGDGREALDRAAAVAFDLVVLDLMLPGVDGIAVCRAIRRGGPEPGRAGPDAHGAARGERQGAGARERRRRLPGQAVRRARAGRAGAGAAAPAARVADCREPGVGWRRRRRAAGARCTASRSIRRAAASACAATRWSLTAQEFRLLTCLPRTPGIVFSREALLARVWPDHTYVTPRSVDTLVKRLRRRVEQTPARPEADPHDLGQRLQVRGRVKGETTKDGPVRQAVDHD